MERIEKEADFQPKIERSREVTPALIVRKISWFSCSADDVREQTQRLQETSSRMTHIPSWAMVSKR